MWNLDLEDMAAAVVQRIPLRTDDEDRYFPNDKFQIMPRHGYTRVFEQILDHPSIRVRLSTDFDKSMLADCAHCFNSMPIDEYFDETFGPLPYRSIRFHHENEGGLTFIGRCGTYQYLDMHQVINQSLVSANAFVASQTGVR